MIRPPRPPGWEDRLAAVVARYQSASFDWGAVDCATFPADVAAAITGADRFAAFRGSYAGRVGAARALVDLGCRDLGDVFARYFTEIAPAMAARGDIGVVKASAVSGCVILGAQAAGTAERGLVRFPRSLVHRAFQV